LVLWCRSPGVMEACVGSMEPSAPERASRLAWKWILEKLVDLPDFGVAFINGSCF
jgi:hypothetical protein